MHVKGFTHQNSNNLLDPNLINEPVFMVYFYIGFDENIEDRFINYFESCYKEKNLQDASLTLQHLYERNKKLPDVLFIDVPLHEEELTNFCAWLKHNLLLSMLPIIYNVKQLSDKQLSKLSELKLVDDVININSHKINYFGKIMFLKQSKLHEQSYVSSSIKKTKQYKTFNIPLAFKRLIDIVAASSCILILSPLLIAIAVAIRLESSGSIFYISLRAGNGFKVFKFFKFRSMVVNADKDIEKLSALNQYDANDNGPKFFKINNDPRITKIGKFLRNTSADELPQLFNVLKGDMSLVGNRPLPIYEAVTLTTDEYVERFSAPAGITGLWQVNKRGKAEMSVEERINLDITYSQNFSFYYDLKIMVKTPMAIFQKSDV